MTTEPQTIDPDVAAAEAPRRRAARSDGPRFDPTQDYVIVAHNRNFKGSTEHFEFLNGICNVRGVQKDHPQFDLKAKGRLKRLITIADGYKTDVRRNLQGGRYVFDQIPTYRVLTSAEYDEQREQLAAERGVSDIDPDLL